MSIEQIKQLHSGDQVFWTDPDEGICSRYYTLLHEVEFISEDENTVCICDKDGSVLECFISELS